MNMLAAEAEMEVRINRHGIFRDDPNFVNLCVELYFERIREMAEDQDKFGRAMARKILEMDEEG